jgi:hypothetical protein
MSNRIKVGDVYFDLPEGALGRPTRVVAEKTDTPDMIEPVAFMSSEPDLITQYIARATTTESLEGTEKSPKVELDRTTEWQAFAGAKSTHPQQWLRYVEGKQRHCGFNTWAFLFGLQWFIFNKMYGKALIAAVFEVFFALVAFESAANFQKSPDFPRLGLPLGLMVLVIGLSMPRLIIGYWANIALLRRAKREIEKVRAYNLDNQRKLAMIASSGSGSFASVVVLYIAIFVVRFVATSH